VNAVTDAELEALEKQIEQLEVEENKQAEEARLAELERQRQEETSKVAKYINARDYSRQENIEVGGQWGPDFIHNRAPYFFSRENLVKYDITFNQSGKYELSVDYAADQSRPVDVYLNGEIIKKGAIATITGGWNPQHSKWEVVAIVSVKQGKNVLRIYRDSVFPHIRNIKFEPIK